MTRSRASARAIKCLSCGEYRDLKHPDMAGNTCLKCASRRASDAARLANTTPTIGKFEKYVMRTSGCWEWTGSKYSNGYGCITLPGKQGLAHRWAYEYFVGEIPDGLVIDHLCRNKACVNPSHLEPVTSRENTRRAMRTHCVNGHEFTPENTYMNRGKRYCRACRYERNKARAK